jgi:hypothetical protein
MQSAWVPSIISGVVAAVLTSLLTPMFQHVFWRAQKLREQKLLLVERFALLMPKLVLIFSPDTDKATWNALVGEIDAVLYACQVLFTKPTREACLKLHFLLRKWQWGHVNTDVNEYFDETYQRSAEVLASLYGEVFSKSITENWSNPYAEK